MSRDPKSGRDTLCSEPFFSALLLRRRGGRRSWPLENADWEVTARQSEGRRRFFYVTQSSTLPNDPNLFRGATGVVDTARNRARKQDREFVSWRLEATVKAASRDAAFPRLQISHVPIRKWTALIS